MFGVFWFVIVFNVVSSDVSHGIAATSVVVAVILYGDITSVMAWKNK